MRIALAMIVKATNEEAELLRRCLLNVSPFVDGIFLTITGKNQKCEEVAKEFNANISYFEWCYDFAKARNYNFSKVPKEYDYIFWLDCDDQVRGIEDLKKTIEENKDVDVFSMNYLYAFDEEKNPTVVHLKTRVVKNDKCVEWAGEIHEDFKENRELVAKFLEGIEILHLTDSKRVNDNSLRNLDIAKRAKDKLPDDPRSYWNLGNASMGANQYEQAEEAFRIFLEKSQSEEEKYLIHMRLSECLANKGEFQKAIDSARYAIGLRPEYPDAYHLAGDIYFQMNAYEKAKNMVIQGLTKKPPYYSIIVYNPRNYDYHPMMLLAKIFWNLSMPIQALIMLNGCAKIYPKSKHVKGLIELIEKEADKMNKVLKEIEKLRKIEDKDELKKAFDKIPEEYQDHPMLCQLRNVHFIKEESSGKDLVFNCGFTEEEWNPDTAKKKGIGGSEEAIIWLSNLLAEKGWNVTVYNNCGHKAKKYGKVLYKPFWSWNYRDKQDVVVLWRSLKALKYEINASKIFIDLHDVISEGEIDEERLKKITKIFVKSDFHRKLFPKVPDDKFVIVPNGIDAKKFSDEMERDPYLMVNTSSPDRSLNVLLDLFLEVKKQVPQAKLKWCYGWKVFDIVAADSQAMSKWKEEVLKKMKIDGFEDLGRINHDDVAKLYFKANIFAYPSEFAEIDCISLSKAMAAGAVPLTTDFAAMGDKVKKMREDLAMSGKGYQLLGNFVKSDKNKDTWCLPAQFDFGMSNEESKKEWVERAVKLLKNPPSESERSHMRKWALDNFDWSKIADKWDEELKK